RALSQIGRVLRFFSSRRRHTSFSRDWSSDVCSSDLFVKPQLSRKLGFNEFMEYDARMISYPNKQSSLLGDAFEAVIGAVYMDKGYRFTKEFLLTRIIKPHVDIHTLEITETNFKSRVIEWCQHLGKEVQFVQVENPPGESGKLFSVEVIVDGEVCGLGRDFNKKSAEKLAAEKACEYLKIFEAEEFSR